MIDPHGLLRSADAKAYPRLKSPQLEFPPYFQERESIRLKREKGKPGPWTTNKVFQNGRFLNVFREDDRGTIALFKEFIEFMPKILDNAGSIYKDMSKTIYNWAELAICKSVIFVMNLFFHYDGFPCRRTTQRSRQMQTGCTMGWNHF